MGRGAGGPGSLQETYAEDLYASPPRKFLFVMCGEGRGRSRTEEMVHPVEFLPHKHKDRFNEQDTWEKPGGQQMTVISPWGEGPGGSLASQSFG